MHKTQQSSHTNSTVYSPCKNNNLSTDSADSIFLRSSSVRPAREMNVWMVCSLLVCTVNCMGWGIPMHAHRARGVPASCWTHPRGEAHFAQNADRRRSLCLLLLRTSKNGALACVHAHNAHTWWNRVLIKHSRCCSWLSCAETGPRFTFFEGSSLKPKFHLARHFSTRRTRLARRAPHVV